jgi:ADP-heptose:LPS heptosyltransferase
MFKVLIDSMSRRFGDTLLGIPFASMFKTKYKDCHITYACSPYDIEFFKNINVVDDTVLQNIYNPSAIVYDMSYDYVLRNSFDSDVKFRPDLIFEGLDNKEGWDKCLKSYPIKFLYSGGVFNDCDVVGKKVGIFINFPRQDMSNGPQEIGVYNRWYEVIQELDRKGYLVYVFTSLREPSIPATILGDAKNATILGNLSACDEISVMSKMDITIGVSSGFLDMAGCFAQKPFIVLNSCESDRTPMWNGIPDRCVLPQNRFSYFVMDREDIRSFIKPPDEAETVPWQFNDGYLGRQRVRQMRVLDAIEPTTITNEVDRLIETQRGEEWFVEGSVCSHCRIRKIYSQCAYAYKPSLKYGDYYA